MKGKRRYLAGVGLALFIGVSSYYELAALGVLGNDLLPAEQAYLTEARTDLEGVLGEGSLSDDTILTAGYDMCTAVILEGDTETYDSLISTEDTDRMLVGVYVLNAATDHLCPSDT